MSLPVKDLESDPVLINFFEAQNKKAPVKVRRSASFFTFFAEEIFPLLATYRDKLVSIYCDENGRPAVEPVLLLGVLVLQFVVRVSDGQAAENVQYDLRWRLALHMGLDDHSFDPSLLTKFRARLLEGGLERVAFEAILAKLVADGWVKKCSKQRLDSTHVCGLLSAMSRLECVRETIRLALEDWDPQEGLSELLDSMWNCYVESKTDPRCGVEKLKAKMTQAGKDMFLLIAWAETQSPEIMNSQGLLLLRRVFKENFEEDKNGDCQQTRAQPTGSVHNPHEPEAQWSSKSTIKHKDWIGYKTQVAETVQDKPREKGEPTLSFITSVVTQNATESDKAGMAEVLVEQASLGLEKPSDLYVDGAYVCCEALKVAEEQGRELHGPAPASPDRGKVFTVDAFDVKVEDRFAICPAGHASHNCSRLEESKTGKISYRIEWKQKLCQYCPLFGQCVSEGQSHRTIAVGELHSLLQERRRTMQTEEYKQDMKHRNGIEGTQSELVRGYGLRHARYRGKARVRLQNYFIGAACNIRRLFRRLAWENG
ncbi:MAG: transposase [Deltaproteobacteria bacterium]|nr:transposase [Deltaproteobacteria bacterium]